MTADSRGREERKVPEPEIPAQYLLSSSAPEPRTLIDILYDTVARHPDAPALDDGAVQLTYAELIADLEESELVTQNHLAEAHSYRLRENEM